jgi:hypothetical protein
MRRIVVEVGGPQLRRRLRNSGALGQLEAMEVLQVLRYDKREFTAICRITPTDPSRTAEEIFRSDPATSEVQTLRRDAKSSIVLLKRLPSALRPGPRSPVLFGEEVTKPGAGYLLGPLAFRDGKVRFSFGGSEPQLRAILAKARSRHLRYRIVSLRDADFAGGLLDLLTERQRDVLTTAHRLGFYDVPRKVDSARLGRELGLKAATVVEHLRKAEKRIMDELMVAAPV